MLARVTALFLGEGTRRVKMELAPWCGAISIVTRRVPSPRNNAVTRANKTPPPFPRPLPTRPVPTIALAGCILRFRRLRALSPEK